MNGPVLLRVVVADDDDRVRQDFARLLDLESDVEVVAVAADGRAAIEASAVHQPDVVVVDVRMPVLDGIEATRRLRTAARAVPPKVLVVTTFDLDDYVLGAVRAGASGFILKDQAPEILATAVRTVAAGEAIVSPRATARLLAEFVPAAGVTAAATAGLTEREVEVARLVARGLSNEEIATEACISRATVKTHVSNILLKLGCVSRIQIAVWAYENGILAGAQRGVSPRRRWGRR